MYVTGTFPLGVYDLQRALPQAAPRGRAVTGESSTAIGEYFFSRWRSFFSRLFTVVFSVLRRNFVQREEKMST